ncbi:Por secretion system C-terminal sorting domain-containing protein [Gillisia sp. Hel1_33_143]|uniref:HYR domain-containing protein n=1 Tax=Gillisia sp. Hel1_33_143 TaxID=1336796 RepID=UPI00087CD6A2|nr:HYR domain-containing protein [Gillisia sp. Hel1_33_143]SDS84434.1 Por secretion system C-terminal sorting domain-containing protein [Gillisia sp. Hel1_33_143]
MKDYFNHSLPTGNIQNARFVNRVVVFVMFFFSMLFFSEGMLGQNGVTISSTASDPTRQNPIPIEIKFDQPINFFEQSDISLVNGSLSDFIIQTPGFNWYKKIDIDNFKVGIADIFNIEAKTNRLVISVATNDIGEIFVLTFGNGIIKYDLNGIKSQFINGNNLESPLDLAINKEGKIFVADNGQARQIKVFSPAGVYLSNENIGNGNAGNSKNNFYGPVGLTFDDEDNLYVADSYSGSDTSSFDRYSIKIYYKDGTYARLIRDSGQEIFNPYRVAVDKQKNIYISDSGGTNGRVIIFDANLKYLDKIEGVSDNLGSPGSIVIDEYGFIYIADLGNDLSITEIFDSKDNPEDLLDVFPIIRDGIKKEDFSIKVYNSNRNFIARIIKEVDLPIDLGLDPCGSLIINNAIFDGKIFGPIPDLNFDFELEFYNRLPDTFTANLTISEECESAKINIPSNVSVNADCSNNMESNNFEIAWDNTNPVNRIDCPQDQIGTLTNGSFELLDYTSLVDFEDNCDNNLEFVQDPPQGTSISSTEEVTIYAIDDALNVSESCTFSVVIDDEVVNPSFTCPDSNDNIILEFDENCNFEVPEYFSRITNFQNFEKDPYFNQTETRNGNTLIVNIEIFDGEEGNLVGECNLIVDLIDVTPPQFTLCSLQDIYVALENGETYSVPDFVSQLTARDNCDSNPVITQSIVAGTQISESVTITLVAKDEFNNESNPCIVQIVIEEKLDPTFECPDPNVVTILPLDENCDYDEPDYSNKITNPKYFIEEAFFIQTSSRTDNTLNVQIEVYDGQGGEYIGKCEFPVTLQDQIPADVKCLEDKLIPYTDSKSFRLEDYREQLTISDNCSSNFEIVQSPAPGTIITDNTTVNFSVTDENNNQSGCSFKIKFFKESELQILNCPGDQFFQVDENCSYAIPDIASTINTNIEGATVTQNITAGFEVNGNLTLTITAKFEDQEDTCEVKLITTDAIFPTIECPADQTEMVQQGEGFQLPNYILNAVYDDNCFIQELKQQPDVGTVIYETTEIILTVVDNYGNSTDCTFSVNIVTENPDLQITCLEDQTANLDINCQFQLPDYTQQAQANFDAAITQSPLPGSLISSGTEITLTATGDSGQTSCSFNIDVVDTTPPVVNCVGTINLRLNAGGTASLSPQDLDDTTFDACGSILRTLSKSDFSVEDLGTNTVRLTVTDASGNSGFCDTTVNVLPYEENAIDFTCKESFILQLDENGEAQLSSEDLYTGTAGNYQFSVDKTSFTCADKGSNTVTLYYSDGNTGGNCRVEVVVEDLLPPVVRTKDISITLEANGTASITPEMLDNGSIDNCGDIRLFLDKTDFTCSDLGENSVILRAHDGSSNSASATATVTVLGNCQEPPVTPTGPGYIFIYPNPTDGPFSYYLPAGIVLEKVEVYDMQGKYITTTLFEEGTVQYKMNLSYLQSAVYVLKLYTNKEELILRVIVR